MSNLKFVSHVHVLDWVIVDSDMVKILSQIWNVLALFSNENFILQTWIFSKLFMPKVQKNLKKPLFNLLTLIVFNKCNFIRLVIKT